RGLLPIRPRYREALGCGHRTGDLRLRDQWHHPPESAFGRRRDAGNFRRRPRPTAGAESLARASSFAAKIAAGSGHENPPRISHPPWRGGRASFLSRGQVGIAAAANFQDSGLEAQPRRAATAAPRLGLLARGLSRGRGADARLRALSPIALDGPTAPGPR